jgi:hypothetical protein
VTSKALIALLQDLYREKAALRDRHVAGATLVPAYDFNNTYQYVIAREEHHVQWVRDALTDLTGDVPGEVPVPEVPREGRGEAAMRAVIVDDARRMAEFIDRWAPRVESLTHARNRTMLRLMLGEMIEQKRFFEQMLAGRDDLLGRRTGGKTTGGGVLPDRWVG